MSHESITLINTFYLIKDSSYRNYDSSYNVFMLKID